MNTVIYALSLTLWLSAHLDDIAARFVGWLFTPFAYGGRHRKAWRELSDWDMGGDAIREQGWEVLYDRQQRAFWAEVEQSRTAAIAAVMEPTPLCPPVYATLAEHGRLRPAMALPPPPIDYSAYSDDEVTAPAVLGLTDEGPIPVATIGELVAT